MKSDDLSRESLFDLYRAENETQTQVLITGLLALERDSAGAGSLESCMRAAHSLKGAASIVGLGARCPPVARARGLLRRRSGGTDRVASVADRCAPGRCRSPQPFRRRAGRRPTTERADEAAVDACLTALAAAGTLVDPGAPSAPLARTNGGRPAVAAPDESDAARARAPCQRRKPEPSARACRRSAGGLALGEAVWRRASAPSS